MEVVDLLKNLNDTLYEFLISAGIFGPILSTIFVVLEGTFAFLPLVVFVTINILTMGPILGSLISWIATTIGGFFAFYLCRKGFSKIFQKFIKSKTKINHFMQKIDKLKFNQLVIIIGIPFAPSFFINVCAGLSNIPLKKYLYSLLIGKIFTIIYLGYIGVNIVECLTNPIIIIKVLLLTIAAYIIGKIINKKFDLDERF